MITKKRQYLTTMGITRWILRAERQVATKKAVMTWDTLAAQVAACTACVLHQTRKQAVFGVGSQHASLMIVGEAPGEQEDLKGEPFVGRAGQLLDAMLRAIDLDRQQVYIANVLKCRPPNNRDPLPAEIQCCKPFLEKQVALLKPRVILALGRFSAHVLLNTQQALSAMRGKQFTYRDTGIPLLVSYHPAYLLRNPIDKRKAYEDLCTVRALLSGD